MNSHSYTPSDAALKSLHDKTLIMIVGPSAIGKSSIMNELVDRHSDFTRVTDFTTRAPRDNDEPNTYRYLSKGEAQQLIKEQRVIQYAVHPETQVIYGTEPQDYHGKYNVLDTLSGVVEDLRTLPFKGTITISLTAPAHQWHDWFLTRYPKPSDERTKRLHEAKQSVHWSMNQTDNHHWVLNELDQQADVAKQITDITLGPAKAIIGLEHMAGDLLTVIDELIFTDASL